MRPIFSIGLLLAGCLAAAAGLPAQAPANPDATQAEKNKPADPTQKPAAAEANPFPEDTSNVPIMTPGAAPGAPDAASRAPEIAPIPLPGEDYDPVRSPEDPQPAATGGDDESSSSLKDLERLLPSDNDEDQGKKKKRSATSQSSAKQPSIQDLAAKDIQVGEYYLSTKNWKAALSRFESAVVLDPENPEVYWGLAEAQHRLGDLANAKANYLKVLDYDPDSPHGKLARKELKDPALANAPAAASANP